MATVTRIKTLTRSTPTMVDKLSYFVFGDRIINEYDENKVYTVDDYVYIVNDDGSIAFFQCILETTGVFDEARWRQVTVISALSSASIISDTEPTIPTMNTWFRPVSYGYGDTLSIVAEMDPNKLLYNIENNEVRIVGIRELAVGKKHFPAGTYKIPKTIEGFPVTIIGDKAFSYVSLLTDVIIGNNVKIIDDNAFNISVNNNSDKTYLKSVTLENTVESIGMGAFSGQTELTDIDIPITVNVLKSNAFDGCTGLTNVTIRNRHMEIQTDAFKDCTSLATIYGHLNSTAEEFARENNYTFELIV